MQKELQNAIAWIVASSANPDQVSLTLKGLLIGAIPAILTVAGVANLNLDSAMLTTLFDSIVQFVNAVLTVIAAGMTLYGVARKLIYTVNPPKASVGQ